MRKKIVVPIKNRMCSGQDSISFKIILTDLNQACNSSKIYDGDVYFLFSEIISDPGLAAIKV